MLWTVRFRHQRMGVIEKLIDASNPEKADAVARAWCDREPTRKFIGVEVAVVADESILPTPVTVTPAPPREKGKAA